MIFITGQKYEFHHADFDILYLLLDIYYFNFIRTYLFPWQDNNLSEKFRPQNKYFKLVHATITKIQKIYISCVLNLFLKYIAKTSSQSLYTWNVSVKIYIIFPFNIKPYFSIIMKTCCLYSSYLGKHTYLIFSFLTQSLWVKTWFSDIKVPPQTKFSNISLSDSSTPTIAFQGISLGVAITSSVSLFISGNTHLSRFVSVFLSFLA